MNLIRQYHRVNQHTGEYFVKFDLAELDHVPDYVFQVDIFACLAS
jgi:hypothetical protein